VFGQVSWAGPLPGSRPTWYLTHEYVGRDPTCDLQELQVAPLTVPLFLEGRCDLVAQSSIPRKAPERPHTNSNQRSSKRDRFCVTTVAPDRDIDARKHRPAGPHRLALCQDETATWSWTVDGPECPGPLGEAQASAIVVVTLNRTRQFLSVPAEGCQVQIQAANEMAASGCTVPPSASARWIGPTSCIPIASRPGGRRSVGCARNSVRWQLNSWGRRIRPGECGRG
jgi:hypothetical protein